VTALAPLLRARVDSRPPRIGLLGPFGFGNLGDAAIQQAVIQNVLRHLPGAEIVGFSLNPADTERRHGIAAYPISRFSETRWIKPRENPRHLLLLNGIADRFRDSPAPLQRLLGKLLLALPLEACSILDASKTLEGMDLFLFSGGGQLDDYWGGPWHHPYTMALWALLARLRGATVCFLSVGAGPIDHPLSRALIRGALALGHYRSFRDDGSRRLISAIGGRHLGPVFPDLAHSLSLDQYSLAEAPRPHALVGIGPMVYFEEQGWPEHDTAIYRRYLEKLASLIGWLLGRGDEVLLFTGEAVHDQRAIAALRALLAERGIPHDDPRVSAPPIESVDDLMAQLARVDVAIASRFHGVLLAQLVNKPVLALSYHPKIDSLMEDMGQAGYCLPIDSFDPELAKERFVAMWANREQIRHRMGERTRAYREALDAQYRAILCPR
jgi:polysaccharide pyruvyl transferase WcaK-like protein